MFKRRSLTYVNIYVNTCFLNGYNVILVIANVKSWFLNNTSLAIVI